MTSVYASTSPTWFASLRALSITPTEVAFWRPSDVQAQRISAGEPWLFKEWGAPQLLGYGRYVEYETTTPSAIWERFGLASGAGSLADLVADITAARRKTTFGDTSIGNVVLSNFTTFDPPVPLTAVGLNNLPVPFRYVPEGSQALALVSPPSLDWAPPLPARRKELRSEVFARNTGHVAHVRKMYGGLCQVTGEPVLGGIGGNLTQIHHIDFLYQGGADHHSNMMSLSPDWHALAHAPSTKFDWAKLEFVVDGCRYGLRLNRHLEPRAS
ncbi:HNH endonuclease signature motif containing protein [Muricoccus nepalensis]|uniref:HNH endonuclease signature motif containing protein n=1 Tax=Muricoccus nepalensis TaxID=1854500 RepID=UPI00112BD301|nr:HNH endonuclease signature motif containing protein [Roseomonas nepalensis]